MIINILQTAYFYFLLFPPSFAFAPPQENPYDLSSFSQKRHNEHPLVEPSSTFQYAPSRVRPPVGGTFTTVCVDLDVRLPTHHTKANPNPHFYALD